MTLKGRLKGKKPVVALCSVGRPKKSGIPTRRWISWILYCRCDLYKQERGLLFATGNEWKERIGDYDPMFRNFLKRGENMHPELFTTRVLIGDFSLRRSPRRGATTEAENNNVDTTSIELNN